MKGKVFEGNTQIFELVFSQGCIPRCGDSIMIYGDLYEVEKVLFCFNDVGNFSHIVLVTTKN